MQPNNLFMFHEEFCKKNSPLILSLKVQAEFGNEDSSNTMMGIINEIYKHYFRYYRAKLGDDIDEIIHAYNDKELKMFLIKKELQENGEILVEDIEIEEDPLKNLIQDLVPIEILQSKEGWSVSHDQVIITE